MIADCTAIVMAGGDSSRMGTDKANVTLGEKTLLQSVIATMQQVFPQVIVSVRQPRAGIDLPQVCDEQPDGGPLAGLVASLGQITTPWAFMVACDMPFLDPAVIAQFTSRRASADMGMAKLAARLHPMHALYSKRCLPVVERMIQTRQLKIQEMTSDRSLHVRYVTEDDLRTLDPSGRSFQNVNTPADLEVARSLLAQLPPSKPL